MFVRDEIQIIIHILPSSYLSQVAMKSYPDSQNYTCETFRNFTRQKYKTPNERKETLDRCITMPITIAHMCISWQHHKLIINDTLINVRGPAGAHPELLSWPLGGAGRPSGSLTHTQDSEYFNRTCNGLIVPLR